MVRRFSPFERDGSSLVRTEEAGRQVWCGVSYLLSVFSEDMLFPFASEL